MLARKRSRAAFTLLELLIVLALTITILAISAPSLRRMYRGMRADAGADTLRAVMARARASAIDQGRPYRVAIVPGESNIRAAPESPDFWQGGEGRVADVPGAEPARIIEGKTPDDVQLLLFLNDGQVSLAGLPQEARETASIPPDEWRTLAVFFPDGSAHKDVSVMLKCEGAVPRVLTLRSLTGAIRVRNANDAERAQVLNP